MSNLKQVVILLLLITSLSFNIYLIDINKKYKTNDIDQISTTGDTLVLKLDTLTIKTLEKFLNKIPNKKLLKSNRFNISNKLTTKVKYTNKSWSKLPKNKRTIAINSFQSTVEPLFIKYANKYNIPIDVYRYKSAQESRWGTSVGAIDDNNLFGIHWYRGCGYNYVYRNDLGRKTKFIIYSSYEESIKHFSKFILKKHYVRHLPNKDNLILNTIKEWSTALCKGGYSEICNTQNDLALLEIYNKYLSLITQNNV